MKWLLIALWLMLGLAVPLRAQLIFDSDRVVVPVGWHDDKITAHFGFTNASKKSVEIADLSTSCGCTTATLEPRVFAPGAHGEIVATMTLDRYLGQESPSKQVVVKTGGADPHTYLLTLVAQWPQVVKVEPRFTVWKVSEPITPHKILLTVVGDQVIHFKTFKVYGDKFTAALKELEAGRRYELELTPAKGVTFGDSATVDVNGDYPAEAPIPVRAYGYVTP